jgi:hypothetical protein
MVLENVVAIGFRSSFYSVFQGKNLIPNPVRTEELGTAATCERPQKRILKQLVAQAAHLAEARHGEHGVGLSWLSR